MNDTPHHPPLDRLRLMLEVRPYLAQGDGSVPPPNGMRSAVPLGGLGAGNFELRADGAFTEW